MSTYFIDSAHIRKPIQAIRDMSTAKKIGVLSLVGLSAYFVWLRYRDLDATKKETVVADQVFQQFLSKLNENEIGTTLVKTTEGCSGYSFKCTMRDKNKVYYFFLKCVKSQLEAHEEILGNTLANKFGWSAPDAKIIYPTINKQNECHFLKAINGPGPAISLENLSFIFMENVKGVNFKDFFSTGQYLEVVDWSDIQIQLGEIAIFDLFTGNNDRFFQTSGLSFRKHVNFGNIMMGSLPSKGNQEHQLVLIDNSPMPGLRRIVAFDIEGEIRRLSESHLPPRRKAQKIDIIKQKFSKRSFVPEIVDNRNLCFKSVISGEKRQPFVDVVCDGLMHFSLENLSDNSQNHNLDGFRESLERSVARGVEDGIDRMRKNHTKFSLEKFPGVSRGTLLLIEKNINELKILR